MFCVVLSPLPCVLCSFSCLVNLHSNNVTNLQAMAITLQDVGCTVLDSGVCMMVLEDHGTVCVMVLEDHGTVCVMVPEDHGTVCMMVPEDHGTVCVWWYQRTMVQCDGTRGPWYSVCGGTRGPCLHGDMQTMQAHSTYNMSHTSWMANIL